MRHAGLKFPNKRDDRNRAALAEEFKLLTTLTWTVESVLEKHPFVKDFVEQVKVGIWREEANTNPTVSGAQGMTAEQLRHFFERAGIPARVLDDPNFCCSASMWNRPQTRCSGIRRGVAGTAMFNSAYWQVSMHIQLTLRHYTGLACVMP